MCFHGHVHAVPSGRFASELAVIRGTAAAGHDLDLGRAVSQVEPRGRQYRRDAVGNRSEAEALEVRDVTFDTRREPRIGTIPEIAMS